MFPIIGSMMEIFLKGKWFGSETILWYLRVFLQKSASVHYLVFK